MGLLDIPVTRESLATRDYDRLRPWFASLANRRREAVSVVVMGDSGIEGYRLANWTEHLPAQLSQELRDRYPSGVTGGRGFISVTPTNTVNIPYWPVVNTGGAPSFAVGMGNKAWTWSAAGKSVLTVQAGGLTAFDLLYTKSATGAVGGAYYKIDGGAAVPFDTNAGTTTAASLRVNAAVTSTIEVGWVSGTFRFSGFREYNGDTAKGVQVHNLGFSGSATNDWYLTGSTAGAWAYFLPLLEPDLVVIQLGGNDNLSNVGNTAPAAFGVNLQNIVTQIRARGVTCPIVLSMCFDISPGAFQVAPWSQYLTVASAIAGNNAGVVYMDYASRIYPASLTDPDGLFLTSPNYLPHQSAKGAAVMASTLMAFLTPR